MIIVLIEVTEKLLIFTDNVEYKEVITLPQGSVTVPLRLGNLYRYENSAEIEYAGRTNPFVVAKLAAMRNTRDLVLAESVQECLFLQTTDPCLRLMGKCGDSYILVSQSWSCATSPKLPTGTTDSEKQ